MAHMFGYPPPDSPRVDRKMLWLVMIPVVTTLLVFDADRPIVSELVSTAALGIGLVAILMLAFARTNPMGWKRLVNPTQFIRYRQQDRAMADRLACLDDTHFIFNDFIFELLRVEHLLICPGGIVVMAKVRSQGPLRTENNVLFASKTSLETLTGNLWRVCHLIHIILQKGYDLDYMPTPVLVVRGKDAPEINDYDGISVVCEKDLPQWIAASTARNRLAPETVVGFAGYLEQRYGIYN